MGRKENKAMIRTAAAAFLLTAFVFVLAFSLNDVGPFGLKTILISDMKKQYIAFYSALREGRFTPYTMEIGLGTPTVALFAYYLSSPFSLLIWLFPSDSLPDALFWIIMLKTALSAVTMSVCLSRQKKNWSVLPLSICYALMSYVFFFFINQFWLDALVWLPLLISSLESLRSGENVGKTVVILTVLFISNYYISYMTGLFTALFLLYRCLEEGESLKHTVLNLGKLALSAVLAFLNAGFLLLPTFYQMMHSLGDAYDGYGRVNYTPKQLILKLFVGYFDSIGNAAAPTIFCGTAVLLLVFLYFLNARISMKRRILSGGFLAFLMISTYLPVLDRIWHGFAYPNAFAYRYAFCIVFLLIWLAHKNASEMEGIPGWMFPVLLVFPALLTLCFRSLRNNMDALPAVYEIILLAAYPLILMGLRKDGNREKVCSLLLLMTVLSEMLLNGVLVLHGVDLQNEFPSKEQFLFFRTEMRTLVSEESDFRIAYEDPERLNAGMEIGFLSPSLFSSAYDAGVASAVKKLGYGSAAKQYWYVPGSPETDRLLGIRCVIIPEKEGNGESPRITKLKRTECADPQPVAFLVPVGWTDLALSGIAAENRERIGSVLDDLRGWDGIFRVEKLESGQIEGLAESDSESLVFVSVPMQNGWYAAVDGKTVPVLTLLDAFIGVPVSAGSHKVVLTYRTPWSIPGTVASVFGILLTILLTGVFRKKGQFPSRTEK